MRWLYGLIAALLSAGLAAAYLGPPPRWFSIVLFALAMGVLNSSTPHVGGQALGVGFVTGDLNKLGGHLALAAGKIRTVQELKEYRPIVYPIAVVGASGQKELAQRFQDYVLSPQGQEILGKYGFGPP